jgi:hypothetical protein
MNIPSNGVSLHVTDQGQGTPAVVFLHCWGGSTRTWDRVIAALPPRYRTVAIDQRGWGASEHPIRGYSIAELADDTEGAIEALGLERYILWPATDLDDTTFSLIASVVRTPGGSGNPMSSVVSADCRTVRCNRTHRLEPHRVFGRLCGCTVRS